MSAHLGVCQEAGIIHPYSAAFSPEYRANVMALFKAGVVRILICMDAAGMVSDGVILHNGQLTS